MRHMKGLSPLGLVQLLLAGSIAQAQTTAETAAPEPEARRYTVEIILFRYSESVSTGNEVFPPELPTLPNDDAFGSVEDDGGLAPLNADAVPEFGDLIPVPDDSAVPMDTELEEIVLPGQRVELQVLRREELQLADVYNKLERLDAYEPVLWSGWTQSVLDRDASPSIPLRRLGNVPFEFDGELQLYLSRFLHLVVDLSLTPRLEGNSNSNVPVFDDRRGNTPFAGYDPQPTGTVRLRINEDRIMKSGDLRYFDHPRFGILAKVTRLEAAEAASNATLQPLE
ncbi:MAG: CsiV family protein [Woeseia sp.]